MKTKQVSLFMLCAALTGLLLAGCGVGGGGSNATGSSSGSVSGVAASGAAIDGTVTLKDSSLPPRILTTQTNAVGAYTFNTRGLKPPFLLKVVWTANATTEQMYSFKPDHGRANINPFSHAVVASDSEESDPATVDANPNPAPIFQTMAGRHSGVKARLKEKLAPLFALYGTTQDPCDDEFEADHTGLDALFDDVRIRVDKASGTVIVTNKATGGVIFSAPINNLDAGTFNPGNMPGAPNGAALYASDCSSCHGPLATSNKLGATAARIQAGISGNMGGMGTLSNLTAVQIQAIATALAGSTPPPAACTYTYDAWSACQPNNTQTRNMLTALPAGCTGTPLTSQACTYVPPTPTTCTYTYSAWGSCQPDNTQTRNVLTALPAGCTGTPATTQVCIYVPPTCTSFTYSAWGACQPNNTQTRSLLTSSPSGCAGGTPVLSQACTYVPQTCTYTYDAWGACQPNNTQTRNMLTALPAGCSGTPVTSQACTYVPPTCTSFTYNAWGACQSNNTQTRTVATSSPAGCTGGTPVTSQACTYVPPTCTSFTYSAWGACQSNNTQTRTLVTSSPAGCTGGTPVLSQACTYVNGTALYNQYCAGCHGNSMKGKSVSATQSAINSNRGGMGSLSFLTAEQLAAIAAAP